MPRERYLRRTKLCDDLGDSADDGGSVLLVPRYQINKRRSLSFFHHCEACVAWCSIS